MTEWVYDNSNDTGCQVWYMNGSATKFIEYDDSEDDYTVVYDGTCIGKIRNIVPDALNMAKHILKQYHRVNGGL